MRQEKEEEKDAYFMDARRRRSVGLAAVPRREKVEKRRGREDFLPFLFWKKGERGVRERKNGKEEKNIILPSARIKLA